MRLRWLGIEIYDDQVRSAVVRRRVVEAIGNGHVSAALFLIRSHPPESEDSYTKGSLSIVEQPIGIQIRYPLVMRTFRAASGKAP